MIKQNNWPGIVLFLVTNNRKKEKKRLEKRQMHKKPSDSNLLNELDEEADAKQQRIIALTFIFLHLDPVWNKK